MIVLRNCAAGEELEGTRLGGLRRGIWEDESLSLR